MVGFLCEGTLGQKIAGFASCWPFRHGRAPAAGDQMVISQMVIIKWLYKNKLVIWFSNGDSKSNGDILFLNITKISPSD